MVLSDKMLKKHLNQLSKQYPSKGLSAGVLRTLLIFTLAMITMPMTVYYMISYLGGSTSYSAFAAVVAVHVILIAFVYKAYKEPVAELELKEE